MYSYSKHLQRLMQAMYSKGQISQLWAHSDEFLH